MAGNCKALGKAQLGGNAPVGLLNLGVVALKQLQKAGLRARGALGAQKRHMSQPVLQLRQIQQQILNPQAGPLAHGGGLGRLKMGEAKGWQIPIFFRKIVQAANHIQQFGFQQAQRVPHNDYVGVIAHIAAGCAQVNNAAGRGTAIAICMHMGHHIMAQLFLISGGGGVVNILRVRFQLRQLFVSNRQAQLLLGFRQHNPQLAPGAEFVVRREDELHFLAGVAAG